MDPTSTIIFAIAILLVAALALNASRRSDQQHE